MVAYEGEDLRNLDYDLTLCSPGVEPVLMQHLVLGMIDEEGFREGILRFAGEDIQKIDIDIGEREAVMPILIQFIPEIPYITALDGYQVQVNKIEVAFNCIYKINPLEGMTAKSYLKDGGYSVASVLSTQIYKMKLEIIKNNLDGTDNFYITDSSGQIHCVSQDRIRLI